MVYVLICGYRKIPMIKGKYICGNGIDNTSTFFKIDDIHKIYRTTNTYTMEGDILDFILCEKVWNA